MAKNNVVSLWEARIKRGLTKRERAEMYERAKEAQIEKELKTLFASYFKKMNRIH